jgi:putative ATP-dependent endonuclease of the OLD family
MYIHSIRIEGFRNFTNTEVEFKEGINVIIGHNNAGKSNLLKAVSLALDVKTSKRLEVEDFNQAISLDNLKQNPPKIRIEVNIHQSQDEDPDSDDLVTVAGWLTQLQAPYKAQLTYEFYLPETYQDKYLTAIASVENARQLWLIIKHDFIRLYVSRIYGGNPDLKVSADQESLAKFDYQFLNAIRDVERDMFTGRNTLLKEVLDFFIDYEIKNASGKDNSEKLSEIKLKKEAFAIKAKDIIEHLQGRMKAGQDHILEYAQETGASFQNATPAFDGSISEVELYSALRLIIKYTEDIEIPATHNGLGYNNLIFMSLLLAKMQVDTDGNYLGSNAKVFPILAIEEPEAHLHPSMQYKFLKFLRTNSKKKARQVFITSHSTHITSAVELDEIICLSQNDPILSVGYPGRVFSNSEEDKASKAYVQRFLDATKSDMLFAKNIILVEGIAEQILLSTFAKYCGNDKILEDNHIAVINIGGRYFNHFLKLFDSVKSSYAILKKVACVTDRDPIRKEKIPGGKFKSCYPFEVGLDHSSFEYKENSQQQIDEYASHANIRFFSQDAVKGKTLEYDLLFCNCQNDLLITDSLTNQEEIKTLMQCSKEAKELTAIIKEAVLRDTEENQRILKGLQENSTLTNVEKVQGLIAARYLNSVTKGQHALELCVTLENNLQEKPQKPFQVPDYLKKAINWVC